MRRPFVCIDALLLQSVRSVYAKCEHPAYPDEKDDSPISFDQHHSFDACMLGLAGRRYLDRRCLRSRNCRKRHSVIHVQRYSGFIDIAAFQPERIACGAVVAGSSYLQADHALHCGQLLESSRNQQYSYCSDAHCNAEFHLARVPTEHERAITACM